MAKPFLRQYEILIKKARVDLQSAKVILKAIDDGDIELDLEVIFFHLQQASEKMLKTILDFNKIKFPHTHDINTLFELLNINDISISDEFTILGELSIYAIEGRYAVIHDDLEDTYKYINVLNELLEFVKKVIQK